jgi:mevalonate kinase
MRQISTLIQINQSLLCALGVSHTSLNTITNLTTHLYKELKCSTKLTGAGGGGCAFTFMEDDDSCDDVAKNNDNIEKRSQIVKEKIEALKWCDKKENEKDVWCFECFTSSVGGKGVLWS